MADPQERLKTYRAKRDFAVTAEPAGDEAGGTASEVVAASPARRYVVQRHRASRLHYDFRLEVDGVLASWAVPQGPTLDPKARRLAVHVEDHPIEYFDFEGVIPKGSYGGGDVIVWDWGTWEPSRPADADAAAAIDQGELHFDLQGEKLAGRFVLVRTDGTGTRAGAEGAVAAPAQEGRARPAGMEPGGAPPLGEDGAHQRRGAGRPRRGVAQRPARGRGRGAAGQRPAAHVGPAHRRRAGRPRRPGQGRHLDPPGPGAQAHQPRQGVVPGPGQRRRGADTPVTKRELIRYHARVAPFMLPYLYDRPINLNRFPDGSDKPGFWHKEVPSHAPEWLTRWHREDVDPGETAFYFVVDSVPALAWMANYGGLELHAWTSRLPDVHQPTWALIDIDPGPKVTFDDVIVLARLYRTALEHLRVVGMPKVTGKRGIQIWVPIADGYSFADTRKWVEKVSRAVGATVPELVSWEWETHRRHGLARLDYTQNAINKTLVAPFSARPAPGAPVSVPIRWDELDDADLRPDRWTIRTVLDRLAEEGDPLGPLIGRQQKLPAL